MGSATATVGSQPELAGPAIGRKHRRHTVRNIAILVVVVGVAISFLTLVPIPRTFTGTLSSSSTTDGIQDFSFPNGAQVTGTWSTSDGVAVTFTIYDSNGNTVFSGNASSAPFAFQSNGSIYTFDVTSFSPETTTVSGSYSSVIWSLART